MEKIIEKILYLIFLVVFGYSIASLIKIGTSFAPDFSVYYYSIHDLLSGKNPYLDSQLYTAFVYPPFSLLFLIPFTFLHYQNSQWLWLILSYIALFLSTFLSLKLTFKKISPFLLALFFSFILLLFPVKFTLGMGQINFFVFLVFIFALYLYERRRDWWVGVLLGLMSILKIPSIFLWVFFLLKRENKILIYASLTFFLLVSLSFVFFGIPIHFYYIEKVFPKLFTLSGKGVYYNQSLIGFVVRFFPIQNSLNILTSTIVIFFLMITFLLTKGRVKKRDELVIKLESSLIIVTWLLVSPLSWQHHFLWLIFPFAVFLRICIMRRLLVNLFLLVFSYLLVAANVKNPEAVQSFFGKLLLSHVFFGTLILWLMINLELLKEKKILPFQSPG